jgi:hypothetical protein
MLRILALLVLAYLVWQGIERLMERLTGSPSPDNLVPTKTRQAASAQGIETALEPCRGCGVHVPAHSTDQGFCSLCRPTRLRS